MGWCWVSLGSVRLAQVSFDSLRSRVCCLAPARQDRGTDRGATPGVGRGRGGTGRGKVQRREGREPVAQISNQGHLQSGAGRALRGGRRVCDDRGNAGERHGRLLRRVRLAPACRLGQHPRFCTGTTAASPWWPCFWDVVIIHSDDIIITSIIRLGGASYCPLQKVWPVP